MQERIGEKINTNNFLIPAKAPKDSVELKRTNGKRRGRGEGEERKKNAQE